MIQHIAVLLHVLVVLEQHWKLLKCISEAYHLYGKHWHRFFISQIKTLTEWAKRTSEMFRMHRYCNEQHAQHFITFTKFMDTTGDSNHSILLRIKSKPKPKYIEHKNRTFWNIKWYKQASNVSHSLSSSAMRVLCDIRPTSTQPTEVETITRIGFLCHDDGYHGYMSNNLTKYMGHLHMLEPETKIGILISG